MKYISTLIAAVTMYSGMTQAQNCSVDPNAMNGPMYSTNYYYRMNASAIHDLDHDTGYFPIPTPASTGKDGMIAQSGWLATNKAHQPIYLPHTTDSVNVVFGWMYDTNSKHDGVDYASSTGSFPARAVADGKVVWIGYMPSPGNVVIIEHTAPDGFRFRTVHHHLRNGRDSDILLARLTMQHSKIYDMGWEKDPGAIAYQKAADLAYETLKTDPNSQTVKNLWGTNDQTLMVKVGQTVKAGDQIGWSGATGINQTGVHLHIAFAREAVFSVNGASVVRWTHFDPYGLYTTDPNCYRTPFPSGSGANQHPTVYAPFFADFGGVNASLFQSGFNYFASVGYAPKFLSHATPFAGPWTVGGSFAPSNGIPVVRTFQTFNEFQQDVNYWQSKNWRPNQISGTGFPSGSRYSSVWAPISEGYSMSHKMSAASFNDTFGKLYGTHTLTDFSAYTEGNNLYFTGIWLTPSKPHGMYFGLTPQEFAAKNNAMVQNGMRLVKLVKYFHPGLGERFAGLWNPGNAKTTAFILDSNAAAFRSTRDAFAGLGFHLSALNMYMSDDIQMVFEK
jgi:Peptidase family M23/Bacterial tandem repeat domain 1